MLFHRLRQIQMCRSWLWSLTSHLSRQQIWSAPSSEGSKVDHCLLPPQLPPGLSHHNLPLNFWKSLFKSFLFLPCFLLSSSQQPEGFLLKHCNHISLLLKNLGCLRAHVYVLSVALLTLLIFIYLSSFSIYSFIYFSIVCTPPQALIKI